MVSFRGKKSCTLKELQSLIGTLNFGCKVVPPDRPFLQRMIDPTRNVSQPHHHIKLSSGVFKDLTMWQLFISDWNGANFLFSTSWVDSDSLLLHPMPPAPLALVEFFARSVFRVVGKPTNSSDSLALALLGKNYLLSLLLVTCGVKIFPTNASFSFVTMSLLLTLSIQNGPASLGSWTLFATLPFLNSSTTST